jgi:multidrug efflux pump subunit AcrB
MFFLTFPKDSHDHDQDHNHELERSHKEIEADVSKIVANFPQFSKKVGLDFYYFDHKLTLDVRLEREISASVENLEIAAKNVKNEVLKVSDVKDANVFILLSNKHTSM